MKACANGFILLYSYSYFSMYGLESLRKINTYHTHEIAITSFSILNFIKGQPTCVLLSMGFLLLFLLLFIIELYGLQEKFDATSSSRDLFCGQRASQLHLSPLLFMSPLTTCSSHSTTFFQSPFPSVSHFVPLFPLNHPLFLFPSF